MITLAPQDVERRIRAWAEVTQLSLDLKRAALKKRHPHLDDRELARMVREEIARYGTERDER